MYGGACPRFVLIFTFPLNVRERSGTQKMLKLDTQLDWLIAIVFFMALIGTIATSVSTVLHPFSNESNVTGAAAVLLGLTTLVVVIIFIAKMAKGGRK